MLWLVTAWIVAAPMQAETQEASQASPPQTAAEAFRQLEEARRAEQAARQAAEQRRRDEEEAERLRRTTTLLRFRMNDGTHEAIHLVGRGLPSETSCTTPCEFRLPVGEFQAFLGPVAADLLSFDIDSEGGWQEWELEKPTFTLAGTWFWTFFGCGTALALGGLIAWAASDDDGFGTFMGGLLGGMGGGIVVFDLAIGLPVWASYWGDATLVERGSSIR